MKPKTPRRRVLRPSSVAALACGVALLGLSACGGGDAASGGGASSGAQADGLKVLRLPMRTDGPKSLDPVRSSTQYENRAVVQIAETLLGYKYLVEPPELEPLLLAKMPEISDDGLTWNFELQKGIRFHDDVCFPNGKGRELIASDVFYSWKRMADPQYLGKSWWVVKDTIVGFDAYKAEQTERVNAGKKFDYEAPVAGMKLLDDQRFQLVLTSPIQRWAWIMAMPQLVIIPREAVEHYGSGFDRNLIGTGPFRLEKWEQGKSLTLVRNPNYREVYYPEERSSGVDAKFDAGRGKRLPLVDRVEITMFPEDQPMWLQFEAGKIDYTQIPAEYFPEVVDKRSRKIRPAYRQRGIEYAPVPLLDFIFRGFNMDDPVIGGYTPERRALRQALACAMDWDEINDTFYNGTPILYDGMVPPGLDGHPKDHKGPVSYRPVNVERARGLLAKAGFPDGKGLPTIDLYINRGGNSPEQAEMIQRHLAKIGVDLSVKQMDFSQLIASIDNKKAQMFSFAWGSDYPDAENNLALFYGPNESPGSNHYNYKNPQFDRMYEQLLSMVAGSERTAHIEKMRDMVMEDCPFVGSQARTREYAIHPWLLNFKPNENFYNWIKYLDVDASKRTQS